MLRAELPVHRNRILKRGMLAFMGLTVAGAFAFQGLPNPFAISSHLRQSLEVGAKPLVSGRTVLEAFEISFQIRRGLRRKTIDPPCSMASALDHSLLTEIGEMLGNFGLRDTKNFLEVTDTKRTACQQMDDPQPRGIAETMVNRDQLHGPNICIYTYICQLAYLATSALLVRVDHEMLWNELAGGLPVSAPRVR
jgi:hypothetical protein